MGRKESNQTNKLSVIIGAMIIEISKLTYTFRKQAKESLAIFISWLEILYLITHFILVTWNRYLDKQWRPDEMQQDVHSLQRQKQTISTGNNYLWPLIIYNGPSQLIVSNQKE